MISGRCGAGSPSPSPSRIDVGGRAALRSAEPSAATPPALAITARSAARILPTAPSVSSYRMMPAAPPSVGVSIRRRKGPVGQSPDAAASRSSGVHDSTSALRSASPTGPAVNGRSVEIVQCSVLAG